jgi:alpha-1,4-digalacturonate transport system substrate-binding protein
MSRASIAARVAGFALAAATTIGAARAADIHVMCYSDGNECDVYRDLAAPFMQSHPDIHIIIDTVPYNTVLQSLPVQLAGGTGPDIARVTDFGTIQKYMLDLRPYLPDADYWETNFGPTLDWLRASPSDKGIYGLLTQLTITGPFVNKTLFEQANVPIPGPDATWDDWAAAVSKVAKATGTQDGMAWDRSGHRFGGPAISYGAKYFAADGKPAVVDDGFKAMASRFVKWNQDGTIDKDVWVSTGSGYRDAFADFQNAKIVMYLSGSWQLQRMAKQIGDAFEWAAVPNPCGPAGCTGMPGGAAFVAFKQTKSPKEVAAFLDYLASQPVYAQMMAKTDNVPASLALQKAGVHYDLPPAAAAAMQVFTQSATKLSPVAYHLQGYKYNRIIFDATADRLSQAIAGQITLDQAYDRITSDIAGKLAAAAQ